jgi:DNA-binding NtrC family response regulator
VGLLPLPLQAHLLRVLTRGEVRRTGASDGERLDVRVLAATSEDLAMQVEVGGFNQKLYEYLAVHQVAVPPLRERVEDIGPLSQQIADSASRELGLESAPVSDEVLGLLQGYGFPGNVRQLRRILEQALRTSRGPITPENISLQA